MKVKNKIHLAALGYCTQLSLHAYLPEHQFLVASGLKIILLEIQLLLLM